MKGGHLTPSPRWVETNRDDLPPFWLHVDSGGGYSRRFTDWCPHVPRDPNSTLACAECQAGWERMRGDEQCIALRSDGTRCRQCGSQDTPFCAFHLDRAGEWFAAKLAHGYMEVAQRTADMHRDRLAREADVDLNLVRDAREALRRSNARVYFFALLDQDLVKIGYSTDPESRVKQFRSRTGCLFPDGTDPSNGELMGTIAGGHFTENMLHQRHRRFRVAGEWFRLTDELRRDIDELIARDVEQARGEAA